MLKRFAVRLLLFGVPCFLSYVVTRPAPPAAKQAFVVCAYDPDGQLVIAPTQEACRTTTPSLKRSVETLDQKKDAKGIERRDHASEDLVF